MDNWLDVFSRSMEESDVVVAEINNKKRDNKRKTMELPDKIKELLK